MSLFAGDTILAVSVLTVDLIKFSVSGPSLAAKTQLWLLGFGMTSHIVVSRDGLNNGLFSGCIT